MKRLTGIWPLLGIMILILSVTGCTAAVPNAKTITYKVDGNCDICKGKIETAATIKGKAEGVWNKDSHILTLRYDSLQANADEIMRRIAYAGYDNELYFAPDAVYEKLPGCCQYERRKTSHREEVITPPVETQTPVTANAQPLEQVYQKYFLLKDALIADNGKGAGAAAGELVAALDAVAMESLGSKEHDEFMKLLPSLRNDAKSMSETADLDKLRQRFAILSGNMYRLMKVIAPAQSVYYDHCPMYNNGKGAYWLSRDKEIRNPYYGAQMLSCGSNKEILK